MANIATSGFTGADGTVISTADANWARVTGFTGTAQLFGNRLRGGSTTDSCAYRYNVAPPSADYEVACDIQVVGTTSTAFNAGVMARASSSASTGYMARWRNGTGFQLFKFVGSVSAVQIGSTVAQSYTAGTTARIRLKVEGSTISVFRGAETTPIISVTDTSITAAGFAGVWTNVNSNTDGPHLDNWTADTLEVVPDVTGSVAGLATMAWSATGGVSADISDPPAGTVTADVAGAATMAWAAVGAVSADVITNMVTEDGIWTWFTEPRAVFYNGAYYVGWINSVGDAGITKVVSATGVRTHFTLKVNLQLDDHNNPAVYIRPDGRIMCFYGMHNDAAGIRYRTTTNPEDISAWGAEQVHAPATLPTCYSNPRYLSAAGRLFYHYRAGNSDSNRPHSIISTANNGATWTAELKLFDSGATARPYVKSTTNGVDRIDFFLTNCHPSEGVASAYHCYALWDAGTSALRYYTSAGVELTTFPINPSSLTLIKSGSPHDNWVWDITYSADGHPRVLYTRFNGSADHRYEFSRWTGSSWTTPVEVCAGGTFLYSGEAYYSGGMCFDGNNANVVYVSRQVSGQWEIQEYRTANDGATWALERSITSGSSVRNARPYSPRGHDNKLGVLWWSGTYTTYINYDTSIRSAEATTAAAPVVVDAAVAGLATMAWAATGSVSADVIALPPGTVTADVAGAATMAWAATGGVSATVLPPPVDAVVQGLATMAWSAVGGVYASDGSIVWPTTPAGPTHRAIVPFNGVRAIVTAETIEA